MVRLETKWQSAAARVVRIKNSPVSNFGRKKAHNQLIGQTPYELKRIAVDKAEHYASDCYFSFRKAQLIGTDSYRIVNRHTASTDGGPFTELIEGLLKFREQVKGEPGVLPNGVQRICTGHLKVRSVSRYARDRWRLATNDFECRLGPRADEEERIASAKEWGRDGGKARFPLAEAGIEKADVAEFWSKQSFSLSLKSHEGNCGGCYMKRRSALIDLIRREFFDLDWWVNWEKRTGQRFRKDRTYSGLAIAAREELTLFEEPEDYDNAITCEGGYCTD